MHKIAAKEFTLDDFSHDHLKSLRVVDGDKATDSFEFKDGLKSTIFYLNVARNMYLETKDKDYWWQMIQILPSSYNQKRTVTMNYENVATIIKQRSNHKLDEWRTLVNVFYWHLPYIKEIMQEN